MQQYRVCYTLGEYANNNMMSSFSSNTNVTGLETVVYAANPGQAQQIVEGQFGGQLHCRVHFATPIY